MEQNSERILGMVGGRGMKICNKLEKYTVKALKNYAKTLNIKVTKKEGKKIVFLSKDEIIKKIKKNLEKTKLCDCFFFSIHIK